MAQSNAAEQVILHMAEQIERAIDDELDRVDNMEDDELMELRKNRMKQLRDMEKQRETWLRRGHGRYLEVTDPKHFFEIVEGSERVVVHFMRRSTPRCEVVERHMVACAPLHFETMFCYIDVERIPSLADRFGVAMLPTLMLIENKNTFHSIIGFDEFGGNDEFTTEDFTMVLSHYGMLNDKGMFAADQHDD